jgi:hypothetical protein
LAKQFCMMSGCSFKPDVCHVSQQHCSKAINPSNMCGGSCCICMDRALHTTDLVLALHCRPVCLQDGNTYSNACEASCYSRSVAQQGECPPAAAGAGAASK